MNKGKIGRVIASIVLAAGMMVGTGGCGDDKVQEIMQQMPSGESEAQTPPEETVSGEESVSAPSEPEFETNPSYTSITDGSMFAELYGVSGINNVSTGYSTQYFTGLVRDILADETLAEAYTNPVDAAVNLLHLGPGKGEVKGDMVKPQVSPGSWMEDLDEDIPLEGTTVTVTYTFDKDGSVVEIPMEVIEASLGIWAPAEGNWSRRVYNTFGFDMIEGNSESEDSDSIQNSTYGLYELRGGEIRCIFPYYTAPDIQVAKNDNVIYFMADSMYQEGNLDYQTDCIAMLDLNTGQVDMESMKFSEGAKIEQDAPIYRNSSSGFLYINDSFHIPYVNVGTADFSGGVCWNDKPVAGLNEAEQNAYGSEKRAKLLSEPGKVLQLSLRTMTETYAYIDMDGDGVTEKIILSGQAFDLPYDEMKLQIGDTILEESRWNLQNDIYGISLDGQEILIVLLEDGASADYKSCFYGYRNGQLVKVGEMPGLVTECVIEDGCISSKMRVDLLQSDFVEGKWHVGADGLLQLVPQDSYDFTGLNDVTLKAALPVHSEPNQKSANHDMQPQTVKFLKTDATFSWVYVQAENGDAGWVYVKDMNTVTELGMYADDVFDELMQFG